MDNRKDLILSLAGAMGMSGKMKGERSGYDSATGTLYCGSKLYTSEDIKEVRKFFEKHRDNADRIGDSSFYYYDVAVGVLDQFIKDMALTGGKVALKENGAVSA